MNSSEFKIIELFAGIGSQTQALKNLGIKHKSIISEIDKFAIKSYNAVHGETENLGDVRKIEKLPYADLITYSFPCQDLSLAGKQNGIKEGTRSGLLLEVERLIEGMEIKPKFLLLENVKNLVGKKHKQDFDRWLNKLDEIGYKNYWQILNAKDYGIPQNRERVFCLSIRKDIDDGFNFPKKQETVNLYSILNSTPNREFLIKENHLEKLKNRNSKVFDGAVTKLINNHNIESSNFEVFFTLTAAGRNCGSNQCFMRNNSLYVLSPLECWRLMGFKDEQFEKAEKVCSNTQLYKQAGNSIVVNVLEEIFKKMIEFGYIKGNKSK